MDLLESLNLDDLPEEQTRAAHLEKALTKDPDIRLGFNACCQCASSSVDVVCRGCRRVNYCSESCCKNDASGVFDDDSNSNEEEGPSVLGHSSIVCALLRLCNDDEDAQVGDRKHDEKAQYRVQTEYESYPATLANIIRDGPCYQDVLNQSEVVIHIVGASVEAELWGEEQEYKLQEVWNGYTEALTVVVESNKRVKTIRLCFIGPDCPKKDLHEQCIVPAGQQEEGNQKSKSGYKCIVTTRNTIYSQDLCKSQGGTLPDADIVAFFNPGFTCTDYSWDDTLACIKRGTPFLVTTNTEMEGVADCQYLLERKCIPVLPLVVAEMVNSEDTMDEGNSDMFFGENPFSGSRVRQSGTMANDLYVRSKWMMGGIFDTPKLKRSQKDVYQERAISEDESKASSKEVKKRKTAGSGNTKGKNPALI